MGRAVSILARLCLSLCCASSVAFYMPTTPIHSLLSSPSIGRGSQSFCSTRVSIRRACSTPGTARRTVLRGWRMGQEMDDMSPEEGMIERLVEKLETSLDAAIKHENFKDAVTLRNELSRMHMDETSAVLKTNSDFYKAFSTKDIGLMGKVWLDNEQVQCIHPGAKPLVGYKNIISMWTNMFQAKDKVFRSTDIKPDNIKVHVRGTSAYVMCNEEVSAPGASRKMVATNIYRKYAGRWYMVHHHASQAVRAPIGGLEEMLRGNTGASKIIRIDGRLDPDSDESPQNMMDEIVKAIQGALEGEDIEISKAEGVVDYGFSNSDGAFGGMLEIEEDNDDDDDDDDDIEDDDDEDSDSEDDSLSHKSAARGGSKAYEDGFMSHERELTEGVTERTVEALRTLEKKGRISKDHKRRLLTDIIQHHKIGDSASSAEIAYELLVMRFLRPDSGDLSREGELLEEFAEQCVAIARRLK